MKTILIYTFMLISFSLFGQAEEGLLFQDERIHWDPSRKLTWEDFKGRNEGDFNYTQAETVTVIATIKSYYDYNGLPIFKIVCYFLPKKSWTITGEDFALDHEQLHFDISELYTRKIRKAFDSLYAREIKDIEIYRSIFNNLDITQEKTHDKYDREVCGISDSLYFDFKKQQEWIKRITKELAELKEWEFIPKTQ